MGAVVLDIARQIGNHFGVDPLSAFEGAIRDVTATIGPRLPQTFADFLPSGLVDAVSPFGTLIGLSQKGSAIGASMPQLDKFMIDDVMFEAVETEQVEFENDIPRHPTESRQMVADHTWRLPKRISVKGSLIGYPILTEKHKYALLRLERIRADGVPVTVISDFPPGRYSDMVISRFSAIREYPWKNEYIIDLAMEQAEYVTPLGAGAIRGAAMPWVAGADPVTELPGSAFLPEGPPREHGLQGGKAGDSPPRDLLGNIFDGIRNVVDKIESVPLGKKLLNMGRAFVRRSVPGAGIVMDALNGNLSAWSAIEGAASFIPGAGALVGLARDLVEPAVQTLNQLGGVGVIAGALTGNTGAAQSLTKGLVDIAAEKSPALGAIAGIVKGALGV